MVAFRSPPELTARIDADAAAHGETRSVAIRRLVELGLKSRSVSEEAELA